MQMSRNMFFALLLSTFIALLLSFLPEADWRQHPLTETPVFQNEQTPVTLNAMNLVDFMSEQPLESAIRKVKWNENHLFVDLYEREGQASEKIIYRDLANLIHHVFSQTNNVQQIFARYVVNEPSREILASLAVKRDEWRRSPDIEVGKSDYRKLLESYYDIQYGSRWEEKFAD